MILLGKVEDDGPIPEDVTGEILSVLGCQNVAHVNQYLRQAMLGHNMPFATEFCTAINKWIFTCPDDATSHV